MTFRQMIGVIDTHIRPNAFDTTIGNYHIKLKFCCFRYYAVYTIYKASSGLKCLEIKEGMKKIKVTAFKWIGNTEMSHSKLVSFDDTVEALKDDPVLYGLMHFFHIILEETVLVDQFSDREND